MFAPNGHAVQQLISGPGAGGSSLTASVGSFSGPSVSACEAGSCDLISQVQTSPVFTTLDAQTLEARIGLTVVNLQFGDGPTNEGTADFPLEIWDQGPPPPRPFEIRSTGLMDVDIVYGSNFPTAPVPEPSTSFLTALGLLRLVAERRRRRGRSRRVEADASE